MRVLLIAGLIGLSAVVAGCGEKAEAQKSQSSDVQKTPSPAEALPEGTSAPDQNEYRKKKQLTSCKMFARHDGKNDPFYALKCKQDLGQEVCEQHYSKEACSATDEDIAKSKKSKNE
ncbi:hypothetical protein EV681_4577 [Advenella incenata]|uniref:Uncharacterized protein n=1 Tax=Advenella incenata TaxID=267800 RepID=A0A4Q7V5H1_9BURK|nr:hypothetical protein [Advenella incenata]RZT91054.1 hypothetical protein EV681_4577 [Advenella incenata]